jgi:hypothetical protein
VPAEAGDLVATDEVGAEQLVPHLEQVVGIKEIALIEKQGIANPIWMGVKEPRLPQTGEFGRHGVPHACQDTRATFYLSI